MSDKKMLDEMLETKREYRDCFFTTIQDREPELGKYCVVDFGSYDYAAGIFIDTPWAGIVFFSENGVAYSLTRSMKYAYLEEG